MSLFRSARNQHNSWGALERLRDCYIDVKGLLDCSTNVFKVLVGAYAFHNMAFHVHDLPSGESECST